MKRREFVGSVLVGGVAGRRYAQPQVAAGGDEDRIIPLPTGIGYDSPLVATAEKPCWVQVDLGSSRRIEAVRLYPKVSFISQRSQGSPVRFRIDVSDDPQFGTAALIADQTGFDYSNPADHIRTFPAAGGSEEEVNAPDHETRWPAFQAAAAGLYYLELDRQERTVVLRFYDFQSKKSRELVRLPVTDASSISTFSVSPDGRYVLYPTVDHAQTALVLTENFR